MKLMSMRTKQQEHQLNVQGLSKQEIPHSHNARNHLDEIGKKLLLTLKI